jgi:hypothetical protein
VRVVNVCGGGAGEVYSCTYAVRKKEKCERGDACHVRFDEFIFIS